MLKNTPLLVLVTMFLFVFTSTLSADGMDFSGLRFWANGAGESDSEGSDSSSSREDSVRDLMEESKDGRAIIVVNIPFQKLRIYKDGRLVMDVNCRVGERVHADVRGTGGNSKTRVGSFRIVRWHERYSNGEYEEWDGTLINKGAFGAFAARINDGHGQMIHGTYGSGVVDWAVVNGNIAGVGIPGSHGCVRLENRHITRIHDICPVGTKVEKIYTTREKRAGVVVPHVNIYGYSDTKNNGYFNPSRGLLVNYRHPSDAMR